MTIVSFFRKSLRVVRLLKHSLNYYAGVKSNEYPEPGELPVIGHFDRKMLIKARKDYHSYFSPENLNLDSPETQSYKKHKVELVFDDGEVLIKKKFTGRRKYNDFYNELLCYEKIGHLGMTPEIVYVDFKKCHIYMKFIDGINLCRFRLGIDKVVKKNGKLIRTHFKKIVRKLHDHGIIFIDIRGQNLILKNGKLFIFDFSDAIYFGNYWMTVKPMKSFFKKMMAGDKKKMKKVMKGLGLPKNVYFPESN